MKGVTCVNGTDVFALISFPAVRPDFATWDEKLAPLVHKEAAFGFSAAIRPYVRREGKKSQLPLCLSDNNDYMSAYHKSEITVPSRRVSRISMAISRRLVIAG
jgi:hypothetical protein